MMPRVDEDLPTLLRALAEGAPAPCLLIGGLALVEFGLPCESFGIDVLIAEPDAAAFDRTLPLLSYRKIAETYCAARYRHSKSLPDLDLWMLPAERFCAMHEAGRDGQCGLRVPQWADFRLLVRPGAEKYRGNPEKNPLSKEAVEERLRSALDRMHETFDPIRYVIYRQEECPLPVKL